MKEHFMLVKAEKYPHEMCVDRKKLEASYEILETCGDILNKNVEEGFIYVIWNVESKLYNGKLEHYGEGETPEKVFEKNKKFIILNEERCYHNFNDEELNTLKQVFKSK